MICYGCKEILYYYRRYNVTFCTFSAISFTLSFIIFLIEMSKTSPVPSSKLKSSRQIMYWYSLQFPNYQKLIREHKPGDMLPLTCESSDNLSLVTNPPYFIKVYNNTKELNI